MFDHLQREEVELLRDILKTGREIVRLLEESKPSHRYTIRITQLKENTMSLGTIAPGSTGQFGAQLLNNGVPDTSSFVPSFTFTASDPSVTFAPATTDASNGLIPLANQTVLSVLTDDTLGSVTVIATTTDQNGATQSGSVTVAIGGGGTPPPANVYSVGVTQLA
jgi:hypothetical protein